MARKVEILIEAVDRTSGALRSITGNIRNVGAVAAGAAAAGIGAVVTGLGAAGAVGLSFNNSMEMVSAQLMAFLKDGKAVDDTLAMITERAAKTPFAFEDMARATASLIPAAKQSGQEIEDLIGLAEILAASNPAEGLEGAAFSIREALSGDFVSIVERFNLPRQRLNELKEQGVPALEAIQTAMQELGLDAELVTNLSQTATGRLSTVKDQLTGIAASLTKPLFEAASASLGTLVSFLDGAAPKIQADIEFVSGRLSILFDALRDGKDPVLAVRVALGTLFRHFGIGGEAAGELADKIAGFVGGIIELFRNMADDPSLGTFIESLGLLGVPQGVQDALYGIGEAIMAIVQPVIDFFTNTVELKDVLIALGIALSTIIIPILLSVIGAIAAVALPLLGLIAAVALLRTAWETDFAGIRDFVGAIWESIKLAFEAFRALFAGDFETFTQKIGDAWRTAWDAVVTFLGNLWTMVQPKLAAWFEAIKNWFITTDWKGLAQSVIDFLVTKLGEFWDFVSPVIAGWWQSFEDWFFNQDWETLATHTVETILTELGLFVGKVVVTLNDWLKAISDWWTNTDWKKEPGEARDKILQVFQDFVLNNRWLKVGQDIIDGIKQGIINAAFNLAKAAADAAWGAFTAAKKALGIDSPSKVFAVGIGRPMVDGIAAGIRSGARGVNAALYDATAGAVDNSRNVSQVFNVYTSRFDLERDGRLKSQFAVGGI